MISIAFVVLLLYKYIPVKPLPVILYVIAALVAGFSSIIILPIEFQIIRNIELTFKSATYEFIVNFLTAMDSCWVVICVLYCTSKLYDELYDDAQSLK